jgi:hypothetical protein
MLTIPQSILITSTVIKRKIKRNPLEMRSIFLKEMEKKKRINELIHTT